MDFGVSHLTDSGTGDSLYNFEPALRIRRTVEEMNPFILLDQLVEDGEGRGLEVRGWTGHAWKEKTEKLDVAFHSSTSRKHN
jgi:hypothetical protein